MCPGGAGESQPEAGLGLLVWASALPEYTLLGQEAWVQEKGRQPIHHSGGRGSTT